MKHDIHILAIDDEPVILDSIEKLCSIEGWKVSKAPDSRTAFEKLKKTKFHLIICDIMLPETDGFYILEKIQNQYADTPVIITTGYSTVENAVKSLYNGAIDFLPKPFSVDELLSSVSRGLRYRRIMQKSAENQPDNGSILYVPCPATYHRLGFLSWMFKEEDGSVRVGLTDMFIQTMNAVSKIDLSDVEGEIVQGNTCAQVETNDQLIHPVLAPLSGRIINRNESLLNDCTLIEKDPYFEGWLYTVIPSDLQFEMKHLTPCSSDRL